jgi:type IX secretion system PorP/SprF family membrane protein
MLPSYDNHLKKLIMKRSLIIIAMSLTGLSAGAQQLQTSSVYELQGVLHNPGMAGMQEHSMVGVTYKTQWSKIDGAPQTATVFGSFSLPKQKLGVSGYAYNDKTGPTSRTGIAVSVAKHIIFNDASKLSLGIETRFQQFAINRSKLSESLGADPALGDKDNAFKYDAGFGIAYINKNLTLGASVSQLVQSKLNFYNGNLNPNQEAKLYRHYYAHGKYKIALDESTIVTPNALLVYLPNAPVEFQVGATVEHFNMFWWGLGVRSKADVLVSGGIKINKRFMIGYCFDIYNTPLSAYETGGNGHEFVLRYEFLKD